MQTHCNVPNTAILWHMAGTMTEPVQLLSSCLSWSQTEIVAKIRFAESSSRCSVVGCWVIVFAINEPTVGLGSEPSHKFRLRATQVISIALFTQLPSIILLDSMPDYPTLVRSEASSPASSTPLQGSIRRRSGAHKWSTLSRKASMGSQQATSCRSWDPQNTEAGGSNARTSATAPSPSPNASHFTAIPARPHRISSHLSPYPRQRERRPTLSSSTSFTMSTNRLR